MGGLSGPPRNQEVVADIPVRHGGPELAEVGAVEVEGPIRKLAIAEANRRRFVERVSAS
jgi:hypothetical protein